MKKKIEFTEQVAISLYKEASPQLKIILEAAFTKKVLSGNPLDRIQTLDDILEIVNEKRGSRLKWEDVLPWSDPDTKYKKSQNANARIQFITEAYNGGEHVLDWSNRQQFKFLLWWERKAHGGGWVLDVVVDDCYCACLGAGSYFKDRNSAQDAANKFKNVWIDLLPE